MILFLIGVDKPRERILLLIKNKRKKAILLKTLQGKGKD